MWTVAQVKPKQVERAIVNLERQRFTVFNPVFTVKRVIRNRVVRLPEPVFPSYVFGSRDRSRSGGTGRCA